MLLRLNHLITNLAFFPSILVLFVSAVQAPARASVVSVKIDSSASHLQLQFTPVRIGEYQFQSQAAGSSASPSEFVFKLPKISAQEQKKLQALRHAWLEAIQIESDQVTQLTLKLKQDSAAKLEVFPYLTDQPYRLIVDIYPSQDPRTLAQSPSAEAQKAKPAAKAQNKSAQTTRRPSERQVSSTDILLINEESVNPLASSSVPSPSTPLSSNSGAFDGDDPNFERFQIRPDQLPSRQVYLNRKNRMDFLEFSLLEDALNEFQEIRRKTPFFQVAENPALQGEARKEADEAKLLVTLFENKRHLVFLEALRKFRQKYPNSNYHKAFRFMEAAVNYALFESTRKLDLFELSMAQHRQALQKHTTPELEKHTRLFVAFAHYDRGDYLNSIRLFNEISAAYPDTELHDLAELFRGLAHVKTNQLALADEIFSRLTSKSESEEIRLRAKAFQGNIQFIQANYVQAIQNYQQVAQNPEFIEKFPSILFNLATAQFRNDELPTSLESFVQFFRHHPDHSHGALAMLRIAELFEVLGRPRDRVFRILREAQFRYGPEPPHLGAAARMRFLSMRFPLMKSAELKSAIDELQKLARVLDFPGSKEWTALITSDGLVEAMDFAPALRVLTSYLQENPTTLSKARFQEKIEE